MSLLVFRGSVSLSSTYRVVLKDGDEVLASAEFKHVEHTKVVREYMAWAVEDCTSFMSDHNEFTLTVTINED